MVMSKQSHTCSSLIGEPHSPSVPAFKITSLLESEVHDVACLTFPLYRSVLVKSFEPDTAKERIIAMVARSGERPVGLILARYSLTESDPPDSGSTECLNILSVMTTPLWRHCGVAQALMKAIATEGIRLKLKSMTTGYTTKICSLVAFEHLLLSTGWSTPLSSMHMSLFKISDMATAPWLSMAPSLTDGYEIFAMTDLKDDERVKLLAGIDAGDIPYGLSPFADEELLVPELSFGLRGGGDVVAWMTLIRSPFVKDALCYRSLFVNPKIRTAHGFGPLLAAHAIHCHAQHQISEERPKGIFGTSFKARKQLNFVLKRLVPHCYDLYETRTSTLILQQE